jgi:glycosyltransferase involved in cell wall biosynthesis
MQTTSPIQSQSLFAERTERALFLCHYDPHSVSTRTRDNIGYIQRSSRFPLMVLNLFEHRHRAEGPLALKPSVNLDEFSAILIHNTVSCDVANLQCLDGYTPRKLRDYHGVKVLIKQEENCNSQEFAKFIGDAGFDLVLTCQSSDEFVTNYLPSRFDDLLEEALKHKGLLCEPCLTADSDMHVLVLAMHDPKQDPRLGWLAQGVRAGVKIHQLGITGSPGGRGDTDYQEQTASGSFIWAIPFQRWRVGTWESWYPLIDQSPAGIAALQELIFFENLLALSDDQYCSLFSAPNDSGNLLRERLSVMLDFTATLVDHARNMRGISAIVAADLYTMPAALILKAIFKIPVLFDAHEYQPDLHLGQFEFERQFWHNLEKRLVFQADYRQTVSPNLAQYMSDQYGVPFESVPNSAPYNESVPFRPRSAREGDQCHFLFQGGLAVHRGLDLLIRAWPKTDHRAILLFRGADGEYKEELRELADATGLLGSRILFPESITEDELIKAAAQADVGVIPYPPVGKNHELCCPNKLSQYMAAGLPMLANRTVFVESTIQEAGCGLVVDFNDTDAIVSAVSKLIESTTMRETMGRAGQQYFLQSFNWEKVSTPFYIALDRLIETSKPKKLEVYVPLPEKLSSSESAIGVSSSRSRLLMTRRQIDELIERYQELLFKHETFCAEVAGKLSSRRTKIQHLEATLHELQSEVVERGKVLDKKRIQLASFVRELDTMRADLNDRDININRRDLELEDLKSRIDQLHSRLSELQTSKSWKFTRPLRELRNKVVPRTK